METTEIGNPFFSEHILPFILIDTGFSHCGGDYIIDRPRCPYCAFEYILIGKSYYDIDGTVEAAASRDLILLPKGDRHFIYSTDADPCEKVWFVCDGELVANVLASYRLTEMQIIQTPHAEKIFNDIYTLSLDRSLTKSEVFRQCSGLFLKLVQQAATAKHNIELQLCDISDRIKFAIDDSAAFDINLDTIVDNCFCTKQYAIHIFKEKFGITPYKYILRKRVNASKYLLSETNSSIREIAQVLGFENSHYFSSFFKKETGITPSEFRKKNHKTEGLR